MNKILVPVSGFVGLFSSKCGWARSRSITLLEPWPGDAAFPPGFTDGKRLTRIPPWINASAGDEPARQPLSDPEWMWLRGLGRSGCVSGTCHRRTRPRAAIQTTDAARSEAQRMGRGLCPVTPGAINVWWQPLSQWSQTAGIQPEVWNSDIYLEAGKGALQEVSRTCVESVASPIYTLNRCPC